MILSIVIPVYNVEKYIERCLNSIIINDIDSLEIELIVIIDGSKDKSDILCNDILKGINNVKIIDQENKGLSGARNTGIRYAIGEYIWFVDSDDAISNIAISDFIKSINKFPNQSIIKIGFDFNLNDTTKIEYLSNALLKGDAKLIKINAYINNDDFKPMSWSYIFKRKFILENNLFFHEGIFHEDEEFIVRILHFADAILVINKIYYHYYENLGSIMTNFKSKSTFDKLVIIKAFEQLMKDNQLNEDYKNFIRYRVYIFYLTILHPKVFYNHTANEKYLIVQELKGSTFYPFSAIKELNFKHQVYRKILNLNIFLYINLRKLL